VVRKLEWLYSRRRRACGDMADTVVDVSEEGIY